MKLILYIILVWFLYQFIFKLVIPVYRTSRKIRQGFQQMQENMNRQQPFGQPEEPVSEPKKSQSVRTKGDYIDFEEVK